METIYQNFEPILKYMWNKYWSYIFLATKIYITAPDPIDDRKQMCASHHGRGGKGNHLDSTTEMYSAEKWYLFAHERRERENS